jgi:hypothetical protein
MTDEARKILPEDLRTLCLKVDDFQHELRHRMDNRMIRDLWRIAGGGA